MNLSPAAVTPLMREVTFSNTTPGPSWSHCVPVQPPEQVQVWLAPSALQTRQASKWPYQTTNRQTKQGPRFYLQVP